MLLGGPVSRKDFFYLISLFLVLLFAVSPFSSNAYSPQEEDTSDIFSLGEIVVTAKGEKASESTEMVKEITSEDIHKSGARTVDEAIEQLSGVNVRTGPEGVPRVDIRGFRNRHVLILLDGIPLNSAFDQQFDPSSIPVENIAKIKVITGASSVLYGPGGLGGIIEIITKRGSEEIRGMVAAETGDRQPYLFKASLSGGKEKFDYFLSGSLFKRDKFPMAKDFTPTNEEKEGYRKNSDNKRENIYGNFGYAASDSVVLSMSGYAVQGSYGKPTSAINNKFDPFASPPRYQRVDDYYSYGTQLTADYRPVGKFSMKSTLFYNYISQQNNQYDNDNYDSFDDPFAPNSFQLCNKASVTGVNLYPKYDFGKAGTLTFLLSGEWDNWHDSGRVKTGGDIRAAGGHGGGGGSPPYTYFEVYDDYNLSVYSIAAEYEVFPVTDLGLVLGLAYHWQMRDVIETVDDYSASVGAYYNLSKDTKLKAAFQRNVQFPSLSQLYLRDSDNPYLQPEVVHHYQIGAERRLPGRTVLNIDLFQSTVENLIAMDQTKSPQRFANFSEVRFMGFEVSAETRFIQRLTAKAGYTYLESKDLSGTGKHELQYTPRDKVALNARYDFDFGLTPYASIIYVANSYVYTKNNAVVFMKEKMNDYTVANVKLSQKLYEGHWIVYAGADNVFNKDYEQTYGIPRPGRFIYGGVEYHY
jgi:outer membrane cobalamin receptor